MRWLLAQRWERLLFAHWPVSPQQLRPLLPPAVEPDVYAGSAWVGVVAFQMTGTRLHEGPRWGALPAIPELNVRTYVRLRDEPGVWFVSLDTSSQLFVSMGRLLFGLRYRRARMTVAVDGETVHYLSASRQAAFSARYAPAGRPSHARSGSLDEFLFERYRLFAERRGGLVTAVVAHEPWPLRAVDLDIGLNDMAPPGLAFGASPLAHYSDGVEARISTPESCAHRPRRVPIPHPRPRVWSSNAGTNTGHVHSGG